MDGKATVAAVAAALGVWPYVVTLVAGAVSRTEILDVDGADRAALDRLLGL